MDGRLIMFLSDSDRLSTSLQEHVENVSTLRSLHCGEEDRSFKDDDGNRQLLDPGEGLLVMFSRKPFL